MSVTAASTSSYTNAATPSTKVIEDVEVLEKHQFKEPSKYRVILHNDDITTFEFVVHILTSVYSKDIDDAVMITGIIHESDNATAGIYTHQIAETKVEETKLLAEANQFPLKATLEEM